MTIKIGKIKPATANFQPRKRKVFFPFSIMNEPEIASRINEMPKISE